MERTFKYTGSPHELMPEQVIELFRQSQKEDWSDDWDDDGRRVFSYLKNLMITVRMGGDPRMWDLYYGYQVVGYVDIFNWQVYPYDLKLEKL